MDYRKSGRSDLELSLMGVGCWSFGGGDYWGEQDQRDVDAVVNRALDLGCTYFDTAEAYNAGGSEASLGIAIKSRRDEAIIGSKVSPCNTQPATLRQHCEASLKRLQTDRIDLYMIHWPIHPHSIRHFCDDEAIINNPPSVQDAFATMMQLQSEGKLRHIGVSNFGVTQLAEALDTGATIAINELPYNLLCRAIELEILPFCREKGIGILSYIPLMQGLLAGKYATPDDVPPKRARTRHFRGTRPGSRHEGPGAEDETFAAIDRIRQIAGQHDISMSDLAIAWCAAEPAVTSVLAGARNVHQLEQNVRAVSLKLDPPVVVELNAATAELMRILGPSPDYYESEANCRAW